MPQYFPVIRMPAAPFDGEWVLYPYDVSDVDAGDRPAELSVGVEMRHAPNGGNGRALLTLASQAEVRLALATLADPAMPTDTAELIARQGFVKLPPQGLSVGDTTFTKPVAGGTLFLRMGAMADSKLFWWPEGGEWRQTVDIARADAFFDIAGLGLPRGALLHAMFAIAAARLRHGRIDLPLADDTASVPVAASKPTR